MHSPRAAQLGLGVAAWLWLIAVVFAPAFVFPIGHVICHQRPDRSFFLLGRQLAVCARCTGIYAGAAIAALLAVRLAVPSSGAANRWLLGFAALPTLVTWTLEYTAVMPFSNLTRFVAGVPLGAVAAWLVLSQLSASPIAHRPSDARVAHR